MLEKIVEEYYEILIKEVEKELQKEQFLQLEKLTVSQLKYLEIIRNNGPVTLSCIAEKLGYANSSVTGMVNRLIKLGLVEKQPSNQDKRVMNLLLTKLGVEAVEIEYRIFMNFASLVETVLDEEERLVMEQLLRKGLDTMKNKVVEGEKEQ